MFTTLEWLFIVPFVIIAWVLALSLVWLAVAQVVEPIERWFERRKWAKEHEAQQRRLRGNDDDMSGGMGGYA